jgi:diacylglycerol kinase family enzyme
VAGTDTALAVLPGGSTNVFARILGLPNDPVAAAKVVAAALKVGSMRRVGLGLVNGRYFCFHTGVGYDAAVVRAVERRAGLKRWAGHPLFVWAAISVGLRQYDRRHPHFRVQAGGLPREAFLTLVLNTDPYTYLGNRPLSLSPDATLDRGLVAVTLKSLSVTSVVRVATSALRGRGVAGRHGVEVATDLRALTVVSADPFPYQVDGDYLGETRELAFEHAPAVITLVLPPG